MDEPVKIDFAKIRKEVKNLPKFPGGQTLKRSQSSDLQVEIRNSTIPSLENSIEDSKNKESELTQKIQKKTKENTAVEDQKNFDEWSIEKLNREIKKKKTEIEDSRKTIETNKNLHSMKGKLPENLDELLELKEDIKQWNKKLEQLKVEIKNMEKELETSNTKIEEQLQEYKKLEKEITDIDKQLSELYPLLIKKQEKLTILCQKIKILRKKENELGKEQELLIEQHTASCKVLRGPEQKHRLAMIKEELLTYIQDNLSNSLQEKAFKNKIIDFQAASYTKELQSQHLEIMKNGLVGQLKSKLGELFQSELAELHEKEKNKTKSVTHNHIENAGSNIINKLKNCFTKASKKKINENKDTAQAVGNKKKIKQMYPDAITHLMNQRQELLNKAKATREQIEKTELEIPTKEQKALLDKALKKGVTQMQLKNNEIPDLEKEKENIELEISQQKEEEKKLLARKETIRESLSLLPANLQDLEKDPLRVKKQEMEGIKAKIKDAEAKVSQGEHHINSEFSYIKKIYFSYICLPHSQIKDAEKEIATYKRYLQIKTTEEEVQKFQIKAKKLEIYLGLVEDIKNGKHNTRKRASSFSGYDLSTGINKQELSKELGSLSQDLDNKDQKQEEGLKIQIENLDQQIRESKETILAKTSECGFLSGEKTSDSDLHQYISEVENQKGDNQMTLQSLQIERNKQYKIIWENGTKILEVRKKIKDNSLIKLGKALEKTKLELERLSQLREKHTAEVLELQSAISKIKEDIETFRAVIGELEEKMMLSNQRRHLAEQQEELVTAQKDFNEDVTNNDALTRLAEKTVAIEKLKKQIIEKEQTIKEIPSSSDDDESTLRSQLEKQNKALEQKISEQEEFNLKLKKLLSDSEKNESQKEILESTLANLTKQYKAEDEELSKHDREESEKARKQILDSESNMDKSNKIVEIYEKFIKIKELEEKKNKAEAKLASQVEDLRKERDAEVQELEKLNKSREEKQERIEQLEGQLSFLVEANLIDLGQQSDKINIVCQQLSWLEENLWEDLPETGQTEQENDYQEITAEEQERETLYKKEYMKYIKNRQLVIEVNKLQNPPQLEDFNTIVNKKKNFGLESGKNQFSLDNNKKPLKYNVEKEKFVLNINDDDLSTRDGKMENLPKIIEKAGEALGKLPVDGIIDFARLHKMWKLVTPLWEKINTYKAANQEVLNSDDKPFLLKILCSNNPSQSKPKLEKETMNKIKARVLLDLAKKFEKELPEKLQTFLGDVEEEFDVEAFDSKEKVYGKYEKYKKSQLSEDKYMMQALYYKVQDYYNLAAGLAKNITNKEQMSTSQFDPLKNPDEEINRQLDTIKGQVEFAQMVPDPLARELITWGDLRASAMMLYCKEFNQIRTQQQIKQERQKQLVSILQEEMSSTQENIEQLRTKFPELSKGVVKDYKAKLEEYGELISFQRKIKEREEKIDKLNKQIEEYKIKKGVEE